MHLTLTKESTHSEMQSYFEKVLELSRSDDQFPIDLDEVWPLVYAEKGVAVRTLKRNFIESEDFIAVDQKVNGGRFAEITYKLTVPCLEYFIARKIRPVFDVYRKVFHKAAKPQSTLDILELTIKGMRENQIELEEVKQDIKLLKAKTKMRPDFFTIVGYATLHGVECGLKMASSLGVKASKICRERGIVTESIPDPRFGKVKTYPESVLSEVFQVNLAV